MPRLLDVTGGRQTIVDDDVYEWASRSRWHLGGSYRQYVRRGVQVGHGATGRKMVSQYLHRLVMGAPDDMQVDHINGDTFDNRRENLRIVTNAQNQQNRHVATGRSGVRGVVWNRRRGVWEVFVRPNRKQIYAGFYRNLADAEQAAKAARQKVMTHAAENRLPPISAPVQSKLPPGLRSKTGFTGISQRRTAKYEVVVWDGTRNRHIGSYDSLNAAVAARDLAKARFGR